MKIIITISLLFILSLSLNSCEKEVSTSPPDPMPQNSGKLFIDSKPEGAHIYLNGKNTGFNTPDTVPYLDGGSYKITLKLNLFKDSSQIVTIRKDSLTTIFMDYTINPTMKGYLNVDSYPQGATITVNDSLTGKVTPFEFNNVLPDSYHVILKKVGYWDWSYTTVVKTGRTSRITGALEDTSVFVNYRMSNSNIPTNYLNGVVVDQSGNKWIVDSYSLTKFDGQNWVSYDPTNSDYIGGNVNSISAFGNEIWVSTANGLIIYKNGVFQTIDMQSGLPANYVFCALKVNDNEMWVGTSNGLCYYNGAWTIFNSSNSGLPLNAISAIEFDENGIMWIGTAGGGIVKYDGANWITYNSDNADLPSSDRVTNISVINANEIWASFTSAGKSDPGGTAYYDGSQWIGYVSVPSDLVLNISIQNPDLIWFCNAENGLTKYENGSWHTYLTSNSRIPSNRIFGVAIDQNGNKWIATYGGGLSKYKGN